MVDMDAVREHVRGLIIALGDDPDREGLVETPDRVARMYEEMFEGMNYTNEDIAEMMGKTFDMGYQNTDMVIVRDIEIFSHCEHHLALMYDMKVTVGYIPKGRVLGLSKIARIAELASKRLQLQERIGADIADIISMAAKTDDVAVYIEGKHSCMTARGIKNCSAVTQSTTMRGRFRDEHNMQNRFYMQLKGY